MNKYGIIGFFLIISAVFFARPGAADEVILNGGKTFTGRIISENENEVTIRSGKSMVFTIEKSKIKQIIKSEDNNRPKGPVVTLEDMQKKSPAPAKTPVSVPSLAKPVVYNPHEGRRVQNSQKDNVSINETLVTKVYPLKGSTQREIARFIYDPEKGLGFRQGEDRDASKTSIVSSWSGKAGKDGEQARWESVIILSTETVLLPLWNAPPQFDPLVAKNWEDLAKAVQSHAEGELKIYSNAMASLGESLVQLRAPSEASLRERSEQIFKVALERAEKQKIGYNRLRRVDWKKILNLTD